VQKKKVNRLDYEKTIKEMLQTLGDNPECGYIKNFVRRDELQDGRKVKVQLLIEIDKDNYLD